MHICISQFTGSPVRSLLITHPRPDRTPVWQSNLLIVTSGGMVCVTPKPNSSLSKHVMLLVLSFVAGFSGVLLFAKKYRSRLVIWLGLLSIITGFAALVSYLTIAVASQWPTRKTTLTV